MRARSWVRPLRVLEWILLAAGLTCTAWYGWTTFEIRRMRAEARQSIGRSLAEPAAPVAAEPAVHASDAEPLPFGGRLIGQLDIPSVGLSASVLDGDDDGVLGFTVGYLPDTPPPWQHGNSVMAAHRDGLFRPLEGIRAGDDIRLTTRHGDYRYRVIRKLIVQPNDVWVLGELPNVDLTLITCFPFTYVGHAPKRFVVQAEKARP